MRKQWFGKTNKLNCKKWAFASDELQFLIFMKALVKKTHCVELYKNFKVWMETLKFRKTYKS